MIRFTAVLFFLILNYLVSFTFLNGLAYSKEYKSIHVMGPLVLNPETKKILEEQIVELKKAGIDGLFFDFWINQAFGAEGCIKFEDGRIHIDEALIDWNILYYYVSLAKKYKIKLSLNLSFHQLGGSVGDGDNYIPINENLKNTMAELMQYKLETSEDPNDKKLLHFLGGKVEVTDLFTKGLYAVEPDPYNAELKTSINYHFFSPFVTQYISDYYYEVMNTVSKKISVMNAKNFFREIIPSLGPAGELRNAGHNNTNNRFTGGFPGPGTTQHSSERLNGGIPLFFFREYLKLLYKNTYEDLVRNWDLYKFHDGFFDIHQHSFNTINFTPEDVLRIRQDIDLSNYGIDYLTFMNHFLLKMHARTMLIFFNKAFESLGDIKKNIKIAGVDWDKLAETNSSVLDFSGYKDIPIEERANLLEDKENEYYELVKLAKEFGFGITFTAGEIPLGYNEFDNHYRYAPKILKALEELCIKLGVRFQLENGLPENLYSHRNYWPEIYKNMNYASSFTFLRFHIFRDEFPLERLKKLKVGINIDYLNSLFKSLSENKNSLEINKELLDFLFNKNFIELLLNRLKSFKYIDAEYDFLDKVTSEIFLYLENFKITKDYNFESVLNEDLELATKYSKEANRLIKMFIEITNEIIMLTEKNTGKMTDKIQNRKRDIPAFTGRSYSKPVVELLIIENPDLYTKKLLVSLINPQITFSIYELDALLKKYEANSSEVVSIKVLSFMLSRIEVFLPTEVKKNTERLGSYERRAKEIKGEMDRKKNLHDLLNLVDRKIKEAIELDKRRASKFK